MTAKDMFEELGYEQVNMVVTVGDDQRGYFDVDLVRFEKEDELGFYGKTYIFFDSVWDKTFQKFGEDRTFLPVNIAEFKAIQKQIEELGW